MWEVKAACVRDANPITTDKSWWLRKNMVTNVIFHYLPQGLTEILTNIGFIMEQANGVKARGKAIRRWREEIKENFATKQINYV
jgi:hypothetical protein